jgi:EAL domain-containing protein (putative c-di-GMP-specific phosphodiesterase class I)
VFIPIAEQMGIIPQIGKFVMEEATRLCATWPDGVSVAVNVSSLQFRHSDVAQLVGNVLVRSGLAASRLEIEVTESAMLENVEDTTLTLRQLSQTGVRISLDDFGTGFSSLSYLHTLPLDKLKIDRSFIENIEKDERSLLLLSGVTHLARELGLSIVIEGVETTEQLDMLRRHVHLNEVQGFLFGRAMPAADIGSLLWALHGSPLAEPRRAAS